MKCFEHLAFGDVYFSLICEYHKWLTKASVPTHGFVNFENVQLFVRLFLVLVYHKLFYGQLYHHGVILFLTEIHGTQLIVHGSSSQIRLEMCPIFIEINLARTVAIWSLAEKLMHEILVAFLIDPTICEKDEWLYSLGLFMPYHHVLFDQPENVDICR